MHYGDSIDFPFLVEWFDGSAFIAEIEGEADIAIHSHADCDWSISEIRARNGKVVEGTATKLLIMSLIRSQCSRRIDQAVMRREAETRREHA